MLRIIHEITFVFAFFCIIVALFLDLHSWTLTVHLVYSCRGNLVTFFCLFLSKSLSLLVTFASTFHIVVIRFTMYDFSKACCAINHVFREGNMEI